MTTTDIILKIITIIFPLCSIVLLGFLYARKIHTDMSVANKLNIEIFCPALIFSVISAKSFDIAKYQTLVISAIVVVLGSGIIAYAVGRLFKVNSKTFVPPMMFNNSGNMGLPLMVLAFGEQALPIAVVFFLVENTLHFTLGTYMLDRQVHPLSVLKIPMIFVTIIALFVSFFQWTVPEYVAISIKMLGDIAIPLMLFGLGVRMTSVDFSAWRIGLLGAIICPLSGVLMAIILVNAMADFVTLSRLEFHYLLLFSALPPAVLNFMLAEKYQQEPQNVASIVLLGNIASVVVIPVVLFYIFRQ